MTLIPRWLDGRIGTTLSWLAYAMSIAAATYAWAVFIASLSVDSYPSNTFLANLVGITAVALYWLILFPVRAIRRSSQRRAVAELCEHAVKLHRIIEHQNQLHCNPGYEAAPGDTYAATLHGRLTGLRMAICILNGWDPDTDADKEGPADELVTAHWEREHTADWETRG